MEETATMREKPQSPETRGELMESARLCGTHRIYRTLLLRAVGQRKERGRERVKGEEGRNRGRERGKEGEEELQRGGGADFSLTFQGQVVQCPRRLLPAPPGRSGVR